MSPADGNAILAPSAAPAPGALQTPVPPRPERPAGSVITFDRSQRAVFDDPSRVIAVNFHRQKGKDFVASAKAFNEGVRDGQDWWIVGMTQAQADETFAKVKKVAAGAKDLLKRKFKSDRIGEEEEQFTDYDRWIDKAFDARARILRLPNGARICSLPGRNPDALAGRTGNMILTEFGLYPNGGNDHWDILFPITTRKGFKFIMISTPRGKNTKFYEVCQNAEGFYSVHTCDIYKSVFEEGYQLYDAKGNAFPQATREEQELAIATFRRIYNSEGKWPREYECKFTGDLSSLIPWAHLERAAELGRGLPFDFVRVEGERPLGDIFLALKSQIASGARVEVGWDVARTGHISSVALNLAKFGQPKHLRFNVMLKNSPFETQRAFVRACMDLQSYSVGHGDATGLGMESNETLAKLYRDRWKGFMFTASGKREIASALSTAFGDGGQTLPAIDDSRPGKYVATDLYAIQKDDTGANLLIEETPNPLLADSHCDVAYSLGLARVAGASNAIMPLPDPEAERPMDW
jgi:phage FluMu gp28-like protein